jgi:hypothetical protein
MQTKDGSGPSHRSTSAAGWHGSCWHAGGEDSDVRREGGVNLVVDVGIYGFEGDGLLGARVLIPDVTEIHQR